jgi:hypothetical protein
MSSSFGGYFHSGQSFAVLSSKEMSPLLMIGWLYADGVRRARPRSKLGNTTSRISGPLTIAKTFRIVSASTYYILQLKQQHGPDHSLSPASGYNHCRLGSSESQRINMPE